MFVLPASSSLQRSALRRTLPGCGFVAADDTSSTRLPRMDVLESDSGYQVVLDLPGVAKEQLDVTVVGRRVEVSTRPAAAGAEDKPRVLYRERGTSPYARTVVLPEEVDNAQSQARFDNGVLTLTLAKRSAAGASKIQVN
jgi:HSP20 family protein